MAGIEFARAVLFTDRWTPPQALPGIELVPIPTLRSGADYSQFVVRVLPGHVHTSHVLISQWDGFVLDAAAWTDEFLLYDYVGAVWPDMPAELAVGNGGFSLRSQRFMAAGADLPVTDIHPEDQVLCRTHRPLLERGHGVRFAPVALARRFAFENESPRGPVFGFHGPRNLPGVMTEAQLLDAVEQLPDEFFRSRDARRLARAMLMHRMPTAARRLLQRRLAAGRRDPNTRLLGALAALQGLLQPKPR